MGELTVKIIENRLSVMSGDQSIFTCEKDSVPSAIWSSFISDLPATTNSLVLSSAKEGFKDKNAEKIFRRLKRIERQNSSEEAPLAEEEKPSSGISGFLDRHSVDWYEFSNFKTFALIILNRIFERISVYIPLCGGAISIISGLLLGRKGMQLYAEGAAYHLKEEKKKGHILMQFGGVLTFITAPASIGNAIMSALGCVAGKTITALLLGPSIIFLGILALAWGVAQIHCARKFREKWAPYMNSKTDLCKFLKSKLTLTKIEQALYSTEEEQNMALKRKRIRLENRLSKEVVGKALNNALEPSELKEILTNKIRSGSAYVIAGIMGILSGAALLAAELVDYLQVGGVVTQSLLILSDVAMGILGIIFFLYDHPTVAAWTNRILSAINSLFRHIPKEDEPTRAVS